MTIDPADATATNSSLSRTDTLYTVFLGVLAFFQLIAVLTYFGMAHLPEMQKTAAMIMYMSATINLAYIAFELVVLIIRIRAPAKRKWPTFALNMAILIVFPFGTALGIWGLMKVT
jgi:hypothetical protein